MVRAFPSFRRSLPPSRGSGFIPELGLPCISTPSSRRNSWFTRLVSLSHLKTLRFKFAPLGSSRYGLRTLGTLELSCVQQEQEDSFMNKDQVSGKIDQAVGKVKQ